MSQSIAPSARAKRWGCSPFVAEWIVMAKDYVGTPDGYRKWVEWAIEYHGQEEGSRMVKQWKKQPVNPDSAHTGDWIVLGVDKPVVAGILFSRHPSRGVNAILQYATSHESVSPPRTRPAIKRRRGENPQAYLSRRHTSLLAGCKPPNFDFVNTQAVALSQLDAAKSEAYVWRADPFYLLQKVGNRSSSIIPFPQFAKIGGIVEERHRIDQAFKSLLHSLHLSHMTWSYVVDLCDELARRGLVTSASVEVAYQKDIQLFYRIAGAMARLTVLRADIMGEFKQKALASPHFQKYVKKWRSEEGQAYIEINRQFIARRQGYDTGFDEIVVKFCGDKRQNMEMFFVDHLNQALEHRPEEAAKFTQEAMDALGDLCIVSDIHTDLQHSTFGRNLGKYAPEMDAVRTISQTKMFERIVSPCDPSKIPPWQSYNSYRRWGDASAIVACSTEAFSSDRLIESDRFVSCFTSIFFAKQMWEYDDMWKWIDECLWEGAIQLDWDAEQKGRFAKEYGLLDPKADRPKFMDWVHEVISRPNTETPKSSTSIQTSTINEESYIPMAVPGETIVQSGHAYRSQEEPKKVKEKARASDGTGSGLTLEDLNIEEGCSDDEPEVLQLVLPSEYRIGKKALKVFGRILEEFAESNDDKVMQKKGQLRWGDFEKAMKRIGFVVIQTAGSSVRFDPPAVKARPISFHRPHPDSILTPPIIKFIGGRLKRCYGWTTDTFLRLEGEKDME